MDIRNFVRIFLLLLLFTACTKKLNNEQEANIKNTPNVEFVETKDDTPEVSTINEQIWMSRNLNVNCFCNGDSIYHAKSIDDWFFCCDNEIPAFYEVKMNKGTYYRTLDIATLEKDDKSLVDTIVFILYNNYAIIDTRKLSPEGWRIPNKTDWNTLFENIHSDKYLLGKDSPLLSFGDPYGFNLYPVPGGFTHNGYDLYVTFSFFWSYPNDIVCIHTLFVEDTDFAFESPGDFRWHQASKYTGCCVRCIKE